MDIEIMIPSDEPVRLLSAVTEELNYEKLTATYSQLGRNEYPPRLLFKVVLYGCCRGIYATREIERACRENVNFMYLLEGQRPTDHNTIARFRKEHLPYAVEELLDQMVKLLMQNGEISFDRSAVFIDGTKIEANANRYSFVWKTAVTNRQRKLGEKIAEELPKRFGGLWYRDPCTVYHYSSETEEAQERLICKEKRAKYHVCERKRAPQAWPAKSH